MSPKEHSNAQEQILPAEAPAPGEVVIGHLAGLSPAGEPLVDFAQNCSGQPLPAITTTAVGPQHRGRQVVLSFVDARLDRPLILGLVHSPLQEMIESFELAAMTADPDAPERKADGDLDEVIVDGKKLVLTAEEEIVLKCGEASITLTRAGKILIRGRYLLNRSSGVNRILGGSVQVN